MTNPNHVPLLGCVVRGSGRGARDERPGGEGFIGVSGRDERGVIEWLYGLGVLEGVWLVDVRVCFVEGGCS